MDIMKNRGSQSLKDYRIDNGLTQNDIAKKVGVKGSTVSRWESGDATPGMPKAHQLFLKTGIPARHWMEEVA
jgi:transcriptional regulator with XRE-family HTH domain